jgi:hypothetical protein
MILFSKMPGARWWTAATVLVSAVVLLNNAIYFDGGPTPRFLLEKGDWARQPWWLAAFYLHVVGASVCLAAGTPLMFPCWTRRYPAWHRRLGYVYVNVVLWMAAPTGLVMAPVAKGGWWGASGFAVTGVLWWGVTWSGYRAILRGDLSAHVRGMVRSYSLALSAPIFRVVQALLYGAGVEDGANYILSLWLSLAASVWLAESFLARRSARRPAAAPALPSFPTGELS